MEHVLESTHPQCGALVQSDGSVRWRVWAPKADRVEVVLIDDSARQYHSMAREDGGFFSFVKDHALNGQRYVYRLNEGSEYPDPASRWQPDGVNHPSAVLRTDEFFWSDETWRGIPREDLMFYEIHVGTFTSQGSFDSIIPRLSALRELGVTALEIMPVGQFSGTRNWGYDGVHPSAPQHSYGGPHGLQRLVNACHAHGLAVFLDVVYNHMGPEGSYFGEYGPYFSDRYRTPWGSAVNYDDRGSDAVREFVLDNVRMWIREYRLDGLRLDAVHAIYDFGARHILRDIKETADAAAQELGRQVHIVAESDLNDVRLLRPPREGGYGLDAQWSDDFHHLVHATLTGERQGYYEDYGATGLFPQLLNSTFVLNGCYSAYRNRRHGGPDAGLPGDRFVVSIQNHDQVGNRPFGERLSTLLAPPAQRLAASLLLLAPYLPILFMGEEYGEEHPFHFFCSFSDPNLIDAVRRGRRREFEAAHHDALDVPDPQADTTFAASRITWSWESDRHKSGLRRLYQDLLHMRLDWPALRNSLQRSTRLLPGDHSGAILELVRGGYDTNANGTIQVLFNLTPRLQTLPVRNLKNMLWTSETEHYHGRRQTDDAKESLLAYECMVFG